MSTPMQMGPLVPGGLPCPFVIGNGADDACTPGDTDALFTFRLHDAARATIEANHYFLPPELLAKSKRTYDLINRQVSQPPNLRTHARNETAAFGGIDRLSRQNRTARPGVSETQ